MPNDPQPRRKRRRQQTWKLRPGDTLTVEGITIETTKTTGIKLPGANAGKIVLQKRKPKLRLDRPQVEE